MLNLSRCYTRKFFCVVCYLKCNPGQGIFFEIIQIFCWLLGVIRIVLVVPLLSDRLLVGLCNWVVNSPIFWRTKKQQVVSQSSVEAEYHAMSLTIQEILWIKALLRDLGVDYKELISLFCYSQVAINIAAYPVFHERTIHIERSVILFEMTSYAVPLSLSMFLLLISWSTFSSKHLGKRELETFISKLDISDLHTPILGEG